MLTADEVLASLPWPVLLVDAGGRVLAASVAARTLLGPADPVGRSADAVVAGRRAQQHPLREGALVVVEDPDERGAVFRVDDLVLHYQPVVRLDDGRPVGLEALARWEHPGRGLLKPVEFLDLMGDPALRLQMSARVLRLACHAAASAPQLSVAVNVSADQLLQAGMVGLVQEALHVAGCPADRLLLEVSEPELLAARGVAEPLEALAALGVAIAVDDVGTDSSPASYLSRFPVHRIKVDRSLVARLGEDSDVTAVVAATVALASAMDVECVAEGVETVQQLSVLQRLGCPLAQGYLFSRPLPLAAVTAWCASQSAPLGPRSAGVKDADEQVLRRAGELQRDGASLHTIAARLNAEGLRNGGRRWHHTTVARLIATDRYPGVDLSAPGRGGAPGRP